MGVDGRRGRKGRMLTAAVEMAERFRIQLRHLIASDHEKARF